MSTAAGVTLLLLYMHVIIYINNVRKLVNGPHNDDGRKKIISLVWRCTVDDILQRPSAVAIAPAAGCCYLVEYLHTYPHNNHRAVVNNNNNIIIIVFIRVF